MAKKRKGVIIYFYYREALELLTPDQKGRLLVAMLEYGMNGTNPDFTDDETLTTAWAFISTDIDRYMGR